MKEFFDLFFEYVGIRGLLALAFGGVYAYMTLAGLAVPQAFENIMLVVLGFYFARVGESELQKRAIHKSSTSKEVR